MVNDGRYLVASVPDVTHRAVVCGFSHDEFGYRSAGVLDESRLRFFTAAGVEGLFEGTDYRVTDLRRGEAERPSIEVADLPQVVAEFVDDLSQTSTFYYIVGPVSAGEVVSVEPGTDHRVREFEGRLVVTAVDTPAKAKGSNG